MKKIKSSIILHEDKEFIFNITVQEKNITFPTNSKLQIKGMSHLWKIVSSTNLPFTVATRLTVQSSK